MDRLKSKIETLLFVSGKPLSINKIGELTGGESADIKKTLNDLTEEYKSRAGGIIIAKNSGKYQMFTSPENAKIVQDFSKSEVTGDLTDPAIETLTIIAYRGPISRPELEEIRGVNCGLIIKNLTIRGLIEFQKGKNLKENYDGKREFSSEENYYSITFDFLKFLGLNSVDHLPDYEKLSQENITLASEENKIL